MQDNIEIWGGIECTLNRVGHDYIDQLVMSGHYDRPEDIDVIALLGIRKLRYPILWEKHMPAPDSIIDWSFTKQSLERIRALNITPIAGLVHHGSGPVYCGLEDDDFPDRLADYAFKVAAKFPWIEYYTPINEPLTTARFCGLYGIWYPHKKEDTAFLKMLVNSCKGTVLAMEAIRKINPAAKLVQTEDLGKTYSTGILQYQAIFENHRRWLSYDLLCGMVNDKHPLWNYFINHGILPEQLHFFLKHPCVPDIIGLDHYHSSQRFLDHRLEHYPVHLHGGNGRHHYADIEAVRVCFENMDTPYNLIMEVWNRYRLPVAVTEVHQNCCEQQQLKWLHTMWETAIALKQDGANILAITSWALLGTYGWDKLVTKANGNYESGAFDVSSGKPVPTRLAKLIYALATNNDFDDLTNVQGWWTDDNRFWYHLPALVEE
jgi:dTDP-4-dehydrorhamnose reductase